MYYRVFFFGYLATRFFLIRKNMKTPITMTTMGTITPMIIAIEELLSSLFVVTSPLIPVIPIGPFLKHHKKYPDIEK